MLVSVIVPVYNTEKYLKQCLDSLVAQTYKNIEVIMVDDGSKDSSGAICDEYAKKYKNFQVIHKKNAGLGMARNTGMEYMNGEYVFFLDSDDYLETECIDILYQNLTRNHVDICKGGFKKVTDSGKVVFRRVYEKTIFEENMAKLELLPRMIGSSPSQHDSVEMCVCGALYKVEPIKKYGLKFPSERELISEDLVFNIDYMQHAKGAYIIERTDYNYRINLTSLTTSYREDRFEASKYFYLTMKEKLERLGYDKQTLSRLDRMFFIYLRMCISQERTIAQKKEKIASLKRINIICSDDVVRKVINNYPKKNLEFRQRVFLDLMWYKMKRILYFMAVKGIV